MKVFNLFSRNREMRNRIVSSRERLYRIAYSWCHDRHYADDLCQETILTALEKMDQLRSEEALDGWMFRIMQNAYRKSFRIVNKQVDVESIEMHMEQEHPAERDVERAEEIIQVRRALSQLKESQRMIVTLVDIEGVSYKEAAEILEIPIGTVMSRLARARSALCHLIEKERQGALKESDAASDLSSTESRAHLVLMK